MDEVTMTVRPFRMGTPKEAALKPLEEAAEAFGAFQRLMEARPSCRDDDCETCEQNWDYYPDHRGMHQSYFCTDHDDMRGDLADEIADCIQACVNLAARFDISLPAAMERCEKRNRDRGRYEVG